MGGRGGSEIIKKVAVTGSISVCASSYAFHILGEVGYLVWGKSNHLRLIYLRR